MLCAIILILCFIFGIIISERRTKSPIPKPYEIVIRSVPVKEVIRYVDRPVAPKQARSARAPTPERVIDKVNKTAYNEAKAALVAMGYRASMVKALLDAIGPCDTAEEYVKKALTRRT